MKKPKVNKNTLYIELIKGVAGDSLSISKDYTQGGKRVAGPKPWGGGAVTKRWVVNPQDLIKDIQKEMGIKPKKRTRTVSPDSPCACGNKDCDQSLDS